jgi:DNA-directed RNA polymerase subunit RPC12/RpoP
MEKVNYHSCPKCNYRQEIHPIVFTLQKVFYYDGVMDTNCTKCNHKYSVKLNPTPTDEKR